MTCKVISAYNLVAKTSRILELIPRRWVKYNATATVLPALATTMADSNYNDNTDALSMIWYDLIDLNDNTVYETASIASVY